MSKLARLLERVYVEARKAVQGTVSRSDAHDVAQEVVMEYLEQIRRGDYKPPTIGLRAAVRKRAKNRAIDHLREAKNRSARESLSADESLSNGGFWMNPETSLEAKQMITRLDRALGRLAPAYVCALIMVREEGFSYEATAERLGITTAGVSQLIVRGQKQLRQALAAEGFEVRGGVPPALPEPRGDDLSGKGSPKIVREEWRVRTVQGLLHDASLYFRREAERRELNEP